MSGDDAKPLLQQVKEAVLGEPLDPNDRSVFRKLALAAFFAWVALGGDGLSSSCYGPPEAYEALGQHSALAVFVALGTAVTICVISAAYSQIIELFPSGGGGYLVASRLLSPKVGMVSGCALLVDYVLVVTLSVASGADAVFSFLPPAWLPYRLPAAVAGVLVLILLNLRGVRESVTVMAPVFILFLATHAALLGYGLSVHFQDMPAMLGRVGSGIRDAHAELGLAGMLLLALRAYSLGAGTYTGLEAVSNGLPILRTPREKTGKRVMLYMAVSLAVLVVGIMFGYLLFEVRPQAGKTLNATLFAAITAGWPSGLGSALVWLTLLAEAMLLFVAAQTGFSDGPRVLANMALDRWLPTRFALLSDRLVTYNGILLMGGAGLGLMLVSEGSVKLLIVLFSINVFVTFVLSQLGMVRHWWLARGRAAHWKKGLCLNGLGLLLTAFILVTVILVKFHEGGWATMLLTGLVVALALIVRRHYNRVGTRVRELNVLRDVLAPEREEVWPIPRRPVPPAPDDRLASTAVIFVGGFSGLGIHSLLSVFRLFGATFARFVFVQIGQVDAGVLSDPSELSRIKDDMARDLDRYVDILTRRGYQAEALCAVGMDVVEEILRLVPDISRRYPKAVFFGGQIILEKDTFFTRLLHNQVTMALQRRFSSLGLPFMVLPVLLHPPTVRS